MGEFQTDEHGQFYWESYLSEGGNIMMRKVYVLKADAMKFGNDAHVYTEDSGLDILLSFSELGFLKRLTDRQVHNALLHRFFDMEWD